jgi:hypothetical protein
MESKIKMDSIFIREMQYSINVYQFAMKRELMEKKKKKKRTWKEGLKGDLGPPVLSLHSHNITRF